MSKTCARCGGDGTIDCPKCDGQGKYNKGTFYFPVLFDEDVDCGMCDATGEISCPGCHGAGEIDNVDD